MDGMNLYLRGPTWWFKFKDHRGIRRRMRGAKNKRAAQLIGSQVQKLVDCVSCGQALPHDLAGWVIHKLDRKRMDLLKGWGVVSDASLSIGNPLIVHLDAWRDGLINRKRPESYATLRYDRAKKLLDASGAKFYSDIDAERVQSVLAEWDGKFSDYTRAHYLSAAKSFCRWMSRTKRSTDNPLSILPVSRGNQKYFRRALNEKEQGDLVVGTRNLDISYGMTGEQRSMLYWVALSTGLRASAVRRLKVKDVRIGEASYLNATDGGAPNKNTSPKPLPDSLVEALNLFVTDRHRDGPLFELPGETKLGRMTRKDAAACGVSIKRLDFHALRHTFGTTMARNGTHPRTLMSLMDHNTIQMTMRLYTHSFPEDQVAAVDRLPDLGGCGSICAPLCILKGPVRDSKERKGKSANCA